MNTSSDDLLLEVLRAQTRVYDVGSPTPLQRIILPRVDAEIYVKREDLGPINAYKWRGAYNCMATLTPEQRERGVVAASAGNHAQGVALAAARLNCHARIFMPRSTPLVKQEAVRRHGGEHVEIVLTGDSYDAASHAAHEYADAQGLTFVHPYDDKRTMGGQGTLAVEVVTSGQGAMDRVYLQIGGGGMAAACACYFHNCWPNCKLVGVEGVGQASMKAALLEDACVTLPHVDVFCDGTAVRTAGTLTFQYCKEFFKAEDFVTVTNEEVCQAIRALWNCLRVVPEPSGAMGLAALLKDYRENRIPSGAKCLVVISGANMDFSQLGVVARLGGVAEDRRQERYLRLPMLTQRGEIIKYLNHIPAGVQLVDVQYGCVDAEIQHPVFGVLGTQEQFEEIERRLKAENLLQPREGLDSLDVTHDADVRFRMISYDRKRLSHPAFFVVDFPERPGAFIEFMEVTGQYADLCYFNYQYSGEHVGRAMVGLDFATPEDRTACRQVVEKLKGTTIQNITDLPVDVRRRVLNRMSPGKKNPASC